MKKSIFLAIAVASMSFGYAQTKATAKTTAKVKTHTVAKAGPVKAEVKPAEVVNAEVKADVAAEPAVDKAPVEFKEIKFSFGKIPQGIPATHVFTFKNTSAGPVVIENAVAGCGCTKPTFPETPVAKGSSDKISVTYNAANIGAFTKTVTVTVAKYSTPIVLTIDGEVVAAEKKEGGK